MTYVSVVQLSIIAGIGIVFGLTAFHVTRSEANDGTLTESEYLPESYDYIDHSTHTPVCTNCQTVMRESGGKTSFDKAETIPVYMRQSYECLNCDSTGVVESSISGTRVTGVVFRTPETVTTTDEISFAKKSA